MSDLLNSPQNEQECLTKPCDGIDLLLTPKEHDLGGFQVRRLLPFYKKRSIGPWVFFDHMGPATFHPGPGINVRPHPHINLATVTYLFEGEIIHRDSLGTTQKITPGAINLMIAGKGIVHSERESVERQKISRKAHGLQLWLALPEHLEQTTPSFHHYTTDEIPAVTLKDASVRVMMGSAYGVTSPVKTLSETLYLEAHLKAGSTLSLPEAQERAFYVITGSIKTQETPVSNQTMAILKPHPITITALEDTHLVLVGGNPLGKRFMEWNFVSSNQERITQAKQDWSEQKFPTIPGDDKEFIPLP